MRVRHWALKAATQKVLSLVPGGQLGNRFLQQHVTRSLDLDETSFELVLGQCRKHLENFFEARRSIVLDFSVLELGTGWHPIIPIGMYLCGASSVVTLDIQPLLNRARIRRAADLFLRYAVGSRLLELLPWVRQKRIETLRHLAREVANSSSLDLLRLLKIHPVVGKNEVELARGRFDLLLSNTTLQYVPVTDLRRIFANFRRLARTTTVMSHHIYLGYDLANFDRSITPYHFLRFSAGTWKVIDSKVHSHNRLRPCDYRRIHSDHGWDIHAEETVFGSPEDLRTVPIAKDFQGYSEPDLLALRTWLVSLPA